MDMDDMVQQDLDTQISMGGHAYVRNLAAAEAAVLRGQFNLAKVLRALAHSQRVQALAAARLVLAEQNPAAALESTLVELSDGGHALLSERTATVRERARDVAQRALASLQAHRDVPESTVAQIVRGCYSCGNLVEGPSEEACDVCGALAPEFERFEPFYSITPEHLGQRSPTDIATLLATIPEELAVAVAGCDDTTLRHKPAADEWCAKELIAHILETELLFTRRVQAILQHSGPGLAAISTPLPPWKLHEGKGYAEMPVETILAALRETRTATVALVRALTPQQWASRGLNVEGTASVLDLGTWLTNHDLGHLAQLRDLCRSSTARPA
jgi:rubrerythrin